MPLSWLAQLPTTPSGGGSEPGLPPGPESAPGNSGGSGGSGSDSSGGSSGGLSGSSGDGSDTDITLPPANLETLENLRDQTKAAQDAMSGVWDSLVGPDSPYWEALLTGLTPIVALGFLFWTARFLIEAQIQGSVRGAPEVPGARAAQGLLVVLLIANDGALLADTVNAFKQIQEEVNNKILEVSVEGATANTIRERMINAQTKQGVQRYLKKQVQLCSERFPVQEESGSGSGSSGSGSSGSGSDGSGSGGDGSKFEECVNTAEQKAKERTQHLDDQSFIERTINWGVEAVKNGAERLYNNTVGSVLSPILQLLTTAFQWLNAIAIGIWGLTAPLWLAVTMLPVGQKGIHTFNAGFFGLGLMSVSYTLINAAVVLSMMRADFGDPLLFAIFTGLVGPLLAIAIGSGGAVSLFVGTLALGKFVASGGKA